MSNIIAIVWDFDKTLITSYMQEPIFKKYRVDGTTFWKEVNALPEKYLTEQGVRVNRDTIYLNHFINYVKEGRFPDLNNEMLTALGSELEFYNGLPALMEITKKMVSDDSRYAEYDIRVEHYIVSTGFTAMIKGSAVAPFVSGIWGCELIEAPNKEGNMVISEIGYTIDNTTKTRALFEINKGVGVLDNIDVNSKLPEEMRRVRYDIYCGRPQRCTCVFHTK